MGSSTSFSAACTTRSRAVGIPSRRSLPPDFGISRSLTGEGRNAPAFRSACSRQETPPLPAWRPRCRGRSRRPRRPSGHRRSPSPGSTQRSGRPGRRRGCTDHRTGDPRPHRPIGAAWSASPVPAPPPLPATATARRYSPAASWPCSTSAANSLRHADGFPVLGLLRRLRPARRQQQTTRLPTRNHREEGDAGRFPRSPSDRSTEEAPSYTPAASPRLPRSTSAWPPCRRHRTGPEVARRHTAGVHRGPAPIRQVRAGGQLEGRYDAGSSRTPFRLACRTRAVWQSRPVPSLAGLLPTLTGASRIRLPPASPGCCDSPAAGLSHLRKVSRCLVAHHVEMPELAGTLDLEDAGTAPARLDRPPLDQLLLAHHPQHALAVDRDTE